MPPKKPKAFNPLFLTKVTAAELKKSRGDQVADFIDTFATQTKDTIAGRAGEPLHLREWQRDLLRNAFAVRADGRLKHRTAIIGMPRKNGKSALGSGIALHSLIMGVDGGEVYSCAADKEQAKIVFNDTKRMIDADEELADLCKLYKDAIEVPSTGSIYRALSSEAFTKEGLNPTTVIYDELHAAPSRELWDVMQLAQGARREPMMFGISTAGVKSDITGQDSIMYELFQYGQKVASGEIVDPTFFMAWFGVPEDYDFRLPDTWRAANPGFDDLVAAEDFDAVIKRTREAEFRTKRLNQFVSSATAWLPSGSWDKLAAPKTITADQEIILGFDGSFNGDTSVIVGVTVEEIPHVFLVKAWERQPTDSQDWRVDILDVENTLLDFCAEHNVREIACDPFRWQRTMAVLEEAGLPIVEWPSTSAARMIPACSKFYDAVTLGNLTHDGSPLISRHLSNAVVKEDRLGTRIVKENRGSPRKIDAAVSSIIGFDRATVPSDGSPVPMFFAF